MKMNCPTCLEPVELPASTSGSVTKCPTCNNEIQVPESVREKPAAPVEAPKQPVTETRRSSRVEAEKPVKERTEAKAESKFSFRILACVLLLLLFLLASVLLGSVATAVHFSDFSEEPLVEVRDLLFKVIGITEASEYTPKLAAFTIGKAFIPALFALFALIAVGRRKQITAIIMLTILVAIGFLIGTPILPIICLILVSVPGRSDVWKRNS